MVKLKILFFLFTFLFIENLFAINGENLYNKYGCYGCHGPEGLGGTSFPSIANKDKDYLIKKLILYKKGNVKTIQAGLMIPFAKNLSLDEIKSYLYS